MSRRDIFSVSRPSFGSVLTWRLAVAPRRGRRAPRTGAMFGYGAIQNASGIYADGVTSSLLAAERTYLAWIRTM